MAVDQDDVPDLSMKIVETTILTKQIEKLIGDDEKQNLLDELIIAPDAGDLIRGSGGLRKLRWSAPGRGKRGGIRVIYYWNQGQVMYLLVAYPKNKKDDLSADELRVLSAVVQEEKATWRRSSSET
ncbi:MAG: type II toxin-antitoxin system RelE/ParE family toxin [Planctomycetota bacterium]|nr:type II toxin-antitoxin system RelE/ParE family toxin [Planctomycetota bacterium]